MNFRLRMFFWQVFEPVKYKESKKFLKACESDEVQAALRKMFEAIFNKVISESEEEQK